MNNLNKPARWVPGRYRITETEIAQLSRVVSMLAAKGWTATAVEKFEVNSLSKWRATAYRHNEELDQFESKLLDVNTINGAIAEAVL